jgi:hypothetical protein
VEYNIAGEAEFLKTNFLDNFAIETCPRWKSRRPIVESITNDFPARGEVSARATVG